MQITAITVGASIAGVGQLADSVLIGFEVVDLSLAGSFCLPSASCHDLFRLAKLVAVLTAEGKPTKPASIRDQKDTGGNSLRELLIYDSHDYFAR